jgi:hypothetical protein
MSSEAPAAPPPELPADPLDELAAAYRSLHLCAALHLSHQYHKSLISFAAAIVASWSSSSTPHCTMRRQQVNRAPFSLSIFQPDCKTTRATTTSNASAAVAANANSAALSTITKVASQRTPPLHSNPRTPAFPLISPLHSHTAQERDAMAAELARLRQALASATGGDPNLAPQTSNIIVLHRQRGMINAAPETAAAAAEQIKVRPSALAAAFQPPATQSRNAAMNTRGGR